MKQSVIAIALSILCVAAQAQEATQKVNPSDALNKEKAEKGWFFYEDPVKPKEETPKPSKPPKPKAEAPAEQKDPCKDPATWNTKCGFVDPGDDFKWQEIQRDALIQNMSMNPHDSKAVEAFQYYSKWMVNKAIAVANMWQYNMVQNPELDPNVKTPISQFGSKLMTEVQNASSEEIFKMLSKNAALVYFTRSDCSFCHIMAPNILRISEKTGIKAWNASLDNKCMPEFKDSCRTADKATKPAQALQVATVPALFLYVEPETWIRVATGVVDDETIKSRIVNFFSAYRQAMLKGIPTENGKPPVDFSYDTPTGTSNTGIAPPKLPTQDDMNKMLKGN